MLTLIVWSSKYADKNLIRKALGKSAVCDTSDDEIRPTWVKAVVDVAHAEKLVAKLRRVEQRGTLFVRYWVYEGLPPHHKEVHRGYSTEQCRAYWEDVEGGKIQHTVICLTA